MTPRKSRKHGRRISVDEEWDDFLNAPGIIFFLKFPSEEFPVNGLDEIQPFLLGNNSSASSTINLPVVPSKRRIDPAVPVGCHVTLLPTGPGGNDDRE